MSVKLNWLEYAIVRTIEIIFSALPTPLFYFCAKILSKTLYTFHKRFRNKALQSLAVAFEDRLSEKERIKIAKKNFENFTITFLELLCFEKISKYLLNNIIIDKSAYEAITSHLSLKQGTILLSGHQANWEAAFLSITRDYEGVAIAKGVKNKKLQNRIIKIRESYKGKIIFPQNALAESRKTLAKGLFVGIVSDQSHTQGSFASNFFNTKTWSSSMPAMLSYLTNTPIFHINTVRKGRQYFITASDPIVADTTKPLKSEVNRIMNQILEIQESNIREVPEQWLWIHDRWKQPQNKFTKKSLSKSFLSIILPRYSVEYSEVLKTIKKIYPHSFLDLYLPESEVEELSEGDEIASMFDIKYYSAQTKLIFSHKIQIVFNFLENKKISKKLFDFSTSKVFYICEIAKKKQQSFQDAIISFCIEDRFYNQFIKSISIIN